MRWIAENDDCSSRVTGSSAFDFDGDGSAEILHADEGRFRIRNGADGTVLYQHDTQSSNTRLEMPIVVDVDNDGNSEIVIPKPSLGPKRGASRSGRMPTTTGCARGAFGISMPTA